MWQKFYKAAGSRLARNIYFWCIVGYMRLTGYEHSYTAGEAIYCAILLSLLAALLYLNNLVLIPGLLSKKRYLLYFIAVAAAIAAVTTISVRIIEYQVVHHPQISIFKTIWVPMPKETLDEQSMPAFIHVFMYSILLLIFTLCWYANNYSTKLKEIKVAKQKQVETELAFLKNQLNPHFLFNTLNNLYGLALQGTNTTAPAILQLSSILRYLLYESNTAIVSFKREKEIMQAYIELELLRLSELDNLVFSINADKDYYLPPLLWLPVLENVFKHSRQSADAEIEFRCHILKDELQIFSRNTYDQDAQVKTGSSGIGLENLRKRLQLIYPNNHTIDMTKEDNAYIVDIKIKLS